MRTVQDDRKNSMSEIKTYCYYHDPHSHLRHNVDLSHHRNHYCHDYHVYHVISLRPEQNGLHFEDNIFKCYFSKQNFCTFI